MYDEIVKEAKETLKEIKDFHKNNQRLLNIESDAVIQGTAHRLKNMGARHSIIKRIVKELGK